MSPRRPRRPLAVLAVVATAALAAAGCGPAGTPTPPPGTPLVVGLGFIPSVQFAPFYLAEREGYYRQAGLDVTFQFKMDQDLIALVGQGSVDIGHADGTSVIPAVSQEIPIRYIATSYARFPSVVFAKAGAGIDDAADLEGKRLGIPGRYGSSWIMLQALLASVGLTPDDLDVRTYPDFGQGAAVQQDAVDAATGFVNNEPVRMRLSGEDVVVLPVDDVVALPGPGLIAGTTTLDRKGEAVRAFVAATLRAMGEIVAEPDRGLEAAIAAVPELGEDRETQAAILDATIETWQSKLTQERGLGAIDRDGWAESIAFMTELGLVPNPVAVDDLVDESFLPSG